MRLAFDAMGGDHAPEEAVKGAMLAISKMPALEIVLFGDEKQIRPYLTNEERITVVHTDEVIHSDEEPVKAVRRKKNASMVLAATAVKEGQADACLSAGSTGAYLATGLFVVGRIAGISRPALAPTFPTVDGRGFVILDVGATSDAKPEYLKQFAVMGSIYAEKVRGIAKPRVGLLNIGTEENKGNDLTKAAFEHIKSLGDSIHFVGNVEARELLNGVADVVVADGFTGNMVLKTTEGTALAMFSMLKEALMSNLKSKLAAAVLKPSLKGLQKKMDYSEYGGACLFGLKAPVVKAHGSSKANAFYNAIRQAKIMAEADIAGTIQAAISADGAE